MHTDSFLHLSSPLKAQQWCQIQRAAKQSIGFVATMGALHVGHLSLIKHALAENNIVIVSIFVNPLQFNKTEDLKNYPRDQARDFSLLEEAGVHAVFTGSADEFLGESAAKKTEELIDPGTYAVGLEGSHRPGHFEGVREVVSRLFAFVGPCRSYFGEKDFQQVQIIKQLADNLPHIDVIMCPTLRYQSGLAYSSRNFRLSSKGIDEASVIYRAMDAARELWLSGERQTLVLQQAMLKVLENTSIELEYAELRDPDDWSKNQPDKPIFQARAFIAGNIEGVRLIDTLLLDSTLN